MHRLYTFLLGFTFISIGHFAQAKIDAAIWLAQFQTPEIQFVELHTCIYGRTLTPQVIDSTSQTGAVEVLLIFRKDDKIVQYDKFRLNAPEGRAVPDIIDLQRYAFEPGDYSVAVELVDANDPTNTSKVDIPFTVEERDGQPKLSDIVLLNTAYQDTTGNHPFARNGVVMEALPSHFYGRRAEVLTFYTEIYNTTPLSEEAVLITFYLTSPKNPGEQLLISHRKRTKDDIIPLLLNIDLREVASGPYQLHVELRNLKRELLDTKTVAFDRSNPLYRPEEQDLVVTELDQEFVTNMSYDSLRYALKAMTPIVSPVDQEYLNDIINKRDSSAIHAQRLFLLSFWTKKNANNPEKPYEEFMKVARAIDEHFYSGFRRGFETDRGYFYLKYGRPDDVVQVQDEMSAPPYEIWVYYDFPQTRQSNVKFLFYNPSLVENDFILLHSTALGERSNPDWEVQLYSEVPDQVDQTNPERTTVVDNFSRRAARLFNDL